MIIKFNLTDKKSIKIYKKVIIYLKIHTFSQTLPQPKKLREKLSLCSCFTKVEVKLEV